MVNFNQSIDIWDRIGWNFMYPVFVPWISPKGVSLPRVPLMSSADSSIWTMVSLSFSLHIILSTRLFWPMILSSRFLCWRACSFFNLRISTRLPILEKNCHYHVVMSTILFLNQLMFYLKCADAANSANSWSISNGTSLFLSLRKKDKLMIH